NGSDEVEAGAQMQQDPGRVGLPQTLTFSVCENVSEIQTLATYDVCAPTLARLRRRYKRSHYNNRSDAPSTDGRNLCRAKVEYNGV
ncbi:hypothetical protein, partial [Paraburkholderia sp. SIMBA_027]|uniref:hypothetical protein n=1 Tax=Paraburkholderia sp. SIMBA_027 TaxID=3085770 RepID=UPI00397A74B4